MLAEVQRAAATAPHAAWLELNGKVVGGTEEHAGEAAARPGRGGAANSRCETGAGP